MSINISSVDDVNEEAVEHLNLVDKECPNCKVKDKRQLWNLICESKQSIRGEYYHLIFSTRCPQKNFTLLLVEVVVK